MKGRKGFGSGVWLLDSLSGGLAVLGHVPNALFLKP